MILKALNHYVIFTLNQNNFYPVLHTAVVTDEILMYIYYRERKSMSYVFVSDSYWHIKKDFFSNFNET
jgi:hypothetical protein